MSLSAVQYELDCTLANLGGHVVSICERIMPVMRAQVSSLGSLRQLTQTLVRTIRSLCPETKMFS